MTEEEVRRLQKKKNDEENVGFRKRTDEGFKDRIVEAETRNRRHLPDYVPEEEQTEKHAGTSPMGDDDEVKLATEEDVGKIRLHLKKIELRLGNIEELLRKNTLRGTYRETRKER